LNLQSLQLIISEMRFCLQFFESAIPRLDYIFYEKVAAVKQNAFGLFVDVEGVDLKKDNQQK
ncbi:MAG: hypothetical protein ACKO96_16195, partial [Flammeovirgaceae bacterium]